MFRRRSYDAAGLKGRTAQTMRQIEHILHEFRSESKKKWYTGREAAVKPRITSCKARACQNPAIYAFSEPLYIVKQPAVGPVKPRTSFPGASRGALKACSFLNTQITKLAAEVAFTA